MTTGFSQGLWAQEKDQIIFCCVHCGERGEAKEKPFPRGLCPNCTGVENRNQMHLENEKAIPGWKCKVPQCVNLST